MVQNWKQEISAQGLSFTTRKNIYGEFRAMINYAVKMEYIPKNPVTIAGNFKAPLEPEKEMLFYTPEEFKRFIAAARKCAEQAEAEGSVFEWNYYVFFNIAFYMGMRKGEINALQWSDIKGDYLSEERSAEAQRRRQVHAAQEQILDTHYTDTEQAANYTRRAPQAV